MNRSPARALSVGLLRFLVCCVLVVTLQQVIKAQDQSGTSATTNSTEAGQTAVS